MSGATSRRKGNKAEVDVVHALQRRGYEAETSRSARGGFQKGPDIVSDFPAAIEVKNRAKMELAEWWKQATEQAHGAPAIVIHKRVGKGDPEDWWVTMDLRNLFDLLERVRDDR